jgi:hypothetical protein
MKLSGIGGDRPAGRTASLGDGQQPIRAGSFEAIALYRERHREQADDSGQRHVVPFTGSAREMAADPRRTASMPPNLIGFAIAALAIIFTVAAGVGCPALAVVVVKFLKFKERELTLEMEHRQKSLQQDAALEERVQLLESGLASLDREVREHLRLESAPVQSLASRMDLVQVPEAPHA